MADEIRIAIVDDHPFFREGVERALRKQRTIKFVGSGATAGDAIAIASNEMPDILLLDIGLPGGGVAAARAIVASGSPTRIIMLTGYDDGENVGASLAAGASGYLLKGADTAELLEAIRTVYQGQAYITPALSSRLLMEEVRSPAADQGRCARLNSRERKLLELAAQGMTNSDIAQQLKLAVPTVKNYMSRTFEKLGVRNRAEAIAVSLSEAKPQSRSHDRP